MTCQPGDSFDVYWPNRATEVEDLLHRLRLQDHRNHRVVVSLLRDTKKRGKAQLDCSYATNVAMKIPFNTLSCLSRSLQPLNFVGAQVPSFIPHSASLLYLLTWCLEIRSVPKKVCE